jgi:hypothetical protein
VVGGVEVTNGEDLEIIHHGTYYTILNNSLIHDNKMAHVHVKTMYNVKKICQCFYELKHHGSTTIAYRAIRNNALRLLGLPFK